MIAMATDLPYEIEPKCQQVHGILSVKAILIQKTITEISVNNENIKGSPRWNTKAWPHENRNLENQKC